MKILKRCKGLFDIWHPDKPKDLIHLDFRPFLYLPEISAGGGGVLVHYQARPKGLREWGFYDVGSDCYFSRRARQVELRPMQQQLVEIDDVRYKSVPTALIFYPGATAIAHPTAEKLIIAPEEMREEIEGEWKI